MEYLRQHFGQALSGEKSFLKINEPMADHTTFGIGGPARWYAAPSREEELRELLLICGQEEIPAYILGNGSDLWSAMRAATAW